MTLSVRSPDERIAVIPHLLGFKPEESLVLLPMSSELPAARVDLPTVVPAGSVNFAFIGQFAETKERDCIFTTEYSVRTHMEAVYTLLGVERGVSEVFNVRALLAATGRLRDGEELHLPGPAFLTNRLVGKLQDNVVGELLVEFGLVHDAQGSDTTRT